MEELLRLSREWKPLYDTHFGLFHPIPSSNAHILMWLGDFKLIKPKWLQNVVIAQHFIKDVGKC